MPMSQWGPLAGLIGTWESGFDGLDVSYHNVEGKIAETAYREESSFRAFGPVGGGDQRLFGLDYRTAIFGRDASEPFHSEVGFWMWDAAAQQVMRCVVLSHGQCTIAGGTVAADATTFRLEATLGSNTYGILSNPALDRAAHTTRFDLSVSLEGDTLSYDQTTVIEHLAWPTVLLHTDRNTLTRVDSSRSA
ncbi:MAG: FABP family protein [Acidimicrobiales bacterium]